MTPSQPLPAPAYTVRLLGAADLEAYRSLRLAGLKADPTAFTSDHAAEVARSAASYATRLGQPPQDHFMLGAFDRAGVLVGAVVCQRAARAKQRHQADLVGMIALPAVRGQGVGRQLLAEFDQQVRRLPGVQQVLLSVTASNQAAVRLYEQAGFARYGLLPRAVCVDGRYFDKALMVKVL